METPELVETLRDICTDGNMDPAEQEIKAFHALVEFARSVAPEIAAEGLDDPLLRIYNRVYNPVMKQAQFDGNGGNFSDLAAELPALTASAAEVVLVDKHGLKKSEARKLLIESCPGHVTRNLLRDWASPSKRLDDSRFQRRLPLILKLEAYTDATEVTRAVLFAFERMKNYSL